MTGQKTLILGNGFDLNLGLKTSYSHFLKTLDRNDSDLVNCLHEKWNSNSQRWVDIENELKELVLSPPLITRNVNEMMAGKPFKLKKSEYDDLKFLLKNYLLKQKLDENVDYSQTSAFKLIHKLLNVENFHLVVLNFNYTDTINDLIRLINKANPTKNTLISERFFCKDYHHIHGDLKEGNNIVFGIDDKANVPDEFDFILKAFDRNTSNLNINRILFNSDEIYFFGYSLGETDSSYFDVFFDKLCKHNDLEENKKTALNFYIYKDQGYKETISRIKHLTNRNLTKFKQYNTVNFFDCNLNE